MLWTHRHPAQTAPCVRGADEDPPQEGWRRLPWPVLDQDQSCHRPRQDWSPPQRLGGSRALFCPSARRAGWGHSCSRWRCRGCPRGVPVQERRGLGKPNWAVGWGSPILGSGHQDVPMLARPRAAAVRTQGRVQEPILWSGSGHQESPGATVRSGALWASPWRGPAAPRGPLGPGQRVAPGARQEGDVTATERNSNQMGPCWLPGPQGGHRQEPVKGCRQEAAGRDARGGSRRPARAALTASGPAAAPPGRGAPTTHQPLSGHPTPLGQMLKP